MKEIVLQKQDKIGAPFSQEDQDKWDEYKPNQLIRCKTYGVDKPRSYQQLKLYWVVCQTVADNNETPGWQTKEQVDFQCRVKLHFVDPNLIIAKPDGSIAVHYRSIAFKNLKHIAACNYFNNAFDVMAKKIGRPVEVLLENAQREA